MRSDLAVGAALVLVFATAATAAAETYELRYGLAAGQTWHAVQTTWRETTVAGDTRSDRGIARFRYEVGPGVAPDDVRLDARMLSQTTSEGPSPLDFSVIHFTAHTGPRGVLRGMHFQLGDAEPPPLEGIEADPVAFRQMLRSVASAWLQSVYWLPELPERPIAVGEAFTNRAGGDVGGTDPGVAMQVASTTTYTLRGVSGRIASFDVSVSSTVDAATAQSGIVSRGRASGEATFDLDLGMWVRLETRSEQRASLRGAGGIADRATGHSVTTIEMRPGEPPDAATSGDRDGV